MLFRKLALLLAVPVLGLCVTGAHAQFGIFGTVTGERITNITCQAAVGVCASPNGTVKPFGGDFGAYYDFRNFGPVRFGAEVRGDVLTGNRSATEYQGGAGTVRKYGALGGVRASFGTPFPFLHPYASVDFGYAKTNATSTDVETYNNFTQAKGIVGLDISILPFLDLRAVELSGGALFGSSTHSTQSVGGGVVFHTVR